MADDTDNNQENKRGPGRPKGSRNRKRGPRRKRRVGTDTIAATIRGGLLAGKSTEAILEDVRKEFPKARTTEATVHNYRSELRRRGAELETVRKGNATSASSRKRAESGDRKKVSHIIREGLLKGLSPQAIISEVKSVSPASKASRAAITNERSRLRKEGHDIPTVRDEKEKAAKTTKPKKRTLSSAIREELLAGKSNAEILEIAQAEFPEAKSHRNRIFMLRSQMRKEGADIPAAREVAKRWEPKQAPAPKAKSQLSVPGYMTQKAAPETTIAIACDHAGVGLKNALSQMLGQYGINVLDLGTDNGNSVDYPDYANAVAQALAWGQASRGIVICGSGIGISMAINRHRHVRAALCTSGLMARFARQHNDANVLALGARLIGEEVAKECLEQFLHTKFEGGRHTRRIEKMS